MGRWVDGWMSRCRMPWLVSGVEAPKTELAIDWPIKLVQGYYAKVPIILVDFAEAAIRFAKVTNLPLTCH
jgi:hypothetical protein